MQYLREVISVSVGSICSICDGRGWSVFKEGGISDVIELI